LATKKLPQLQQQRRVLEAQALAVKQNCVLVVDSGDRHNLI